MCYASIRSEQNFRSIKLADFSSLELLKDQLCPVLSQLKAQKTSAAVRQTNKLTLAGRKGGWCHPPQTVFPELLENGGAERRQNLAMLPYIQGGPDDVLKIFGSGQVTDL